MAGSTYGLGSVTFAAVAITGVKSIRCAFQGTEADTGADGDLYRTLAWVEDLLIGGTVETTDVNAALSRTMGTKGTMVLTFRPRAGGTGYGTSKTATITNAVLGALEGTAPHAGESSATIPFRAYSADGSTSPLTFA